MSQQQLLLLLIGLPPRPSSLRVRVWRRLKSLGAVALKRSAYLLPDTPERYEDFQWLAQEVQREGGDATLIRVQQIENLGPGDVLRLFHEPRDRDYRQLAARYRRALQRLERKSVSPRIQDELARLSRDHQRIRDVDFFDAPGGAEVRRLEEAIAMRTRRPETMRRDERPKLDLSKLRGRRWVTRPRPHIDRMMMSLGIADVMTKKTLLEQGSVRAAARVASGEAELLITLVSEILPAPGVELAGPLPMQFQNYVSFAAATGAKSDNASAGKSLVSCLSGPSVENTLKAKGMEKGGS